MTEWQRATWILFHTITLNYNEQYKEEYKNFFESLKITIPCKICRNHYTQNVNKDELSFERNINPDRIFNWTVDLHNEVNKMHRKKVWSYDEARNFYTRFNFNNGVLKFVILQYVRANFRKGPEKTEGLFRMLRSLSYLHPNEDKRNKLIGFKEKFELNRETMRNWLLAFLMIIKS